MLTASITGFPYKLFFLLHILSVIVGFAPIFVRPFLGLGARSGAVALPGPLADQLARATRLVHGPAIVLAGIFGSGLVGFSDDVYEMSDHWISIAFVLWAAMIAVVFAVQVPAERRAMGGDVAAAARASMATGALHVLLLLMLVDMIWKPFR